MTGHILYILELSPVSNFWTNWHEKYCKQETFMFFFSGKFLLWKRFRKRFKLKLLSPSSLSSWNRIGLSQTILDCLAILTTLINQLNWSFQRSSGCLLLQYPLLGLYCRSKCRHFALILERWSKYLCWFSWMFFKNTQGWEEGSYSHSENSLSKG